MARIAYELPFSLVRNDAPFRLMRRIGLVPADGIGAVRRAVLFAAIAWLPLAMWAYFTGRALPGGTVSEPLLQHFGVHVRGLLAIPILILAQVSALRITSYLVPWFVRSGVVPQREIPRFEAVVASSMRLRDQSAPWIAIVVVAILWSTGASVMATEHTIEWAGERSGGKIAAMGFGGWWYVVVTRPMYVLLVAAWVWRVVMLAVLFWRIGKLDLHLVPTHYDRFGGLGFVDRFVLMWSPVVFVLSAVLASTWAHEALYHGIDVKSHAWSAALFLVTLLAVFLAPLFALTPTLMHFKRSADLDYGSLVRRHNELVHAKWIERREVKDDGLLEAPEIGPVADTVGMGDAAARMRIVPVSRRAVLAIVLPALLPMIALVATQYRVDEILMKLIQALG